MQIKPDRTSSGEKEEMRIKELKFLKSIQKALEKTLVA